MFITQLIGNATRKYSLNIAIKELNNVQPNFYKYIAILWLDGSP